MKKHLVALLSMVGLAGSASPMHGQVLKSSGQESKAESRLKLNKQKQETNAVQKVRELKNTKGDAAAIKHTEKGAKADAQRKSVHSDLQKKTTKTKAGVKGESQGKQ